MDKLVNLAMPFPSETCWSECGWGVPSPAVGLSLLVLLPPRQKGPKSLWLSPLDKAVILEMHELQLVQQWWLSTNLHNFVGTPNHPPLKIHCFNAKS